MTHYAGSIAHTLADASNAADFYQTIAVDWTGRVGIVDTLASDTWTDNDDGSQYSYSINAPYDPAETADELVAYPAASGPLSHWTVAGLIKRTGDLDPGQAYALATLDLDYWPDHDDDDDTPEPDVIGYIVVLSIVTASALDWEPIR